MLKINYCLNFPGGSDGKSVCLQYGRPGFNPWAGKILWRRKWQPTLIFLPVESHGQRSLADYSPRGHNESDMTECAYHVCKLRHHLDSLKHKEMSQGVKAQGRQRWGEAGRQRWGEPLRGVG